MLKQLKQQVYDANMALESYGLITFTWGNVSGIDRESGLFVIKPSGISYKELKPEYMVVVDLKGNVIDSAFKPSSDTDTHIVLYNNFKNIGGVVHTHSTYATATAQAGKGVRALGTTHADYFHGNIPITRNMTKEEINGKYELETGNVIVETFIDLNPDSIKAVLVKSHGPFTWGKTPMDAVHNAVVLEEVSKMALFTTTLNPTVTEMDKTLCDKHFLRKHGVNSYYGQN